MSKLEFIAVNGSFAMFALSHLVWHDLPNTVFWGFLTAINLIAVVRSEL